MHNHAHSGFCPKDGGTGRNGGHGYGALGTMEDVLTVALAGVDHSIILPLKLGPSIALQVQTGATFCPSMAPKLLVMLMVPHFTGVVYVVTGIQLMLLSNTSAIPPVKMAVHLPSLPLICFTDKLLPGLLTPPLLIFHPTICVLLCHYLLPSLPMPHFPSHYFWGCLLSDL